MDLQRAKELASGLADGADPLTGEVLPDVRCRGRQAPISNARKAA